MPIHSSEDRHQLKMLSLEEHVSEDSNARVIDAFINAVDLEKLGFKFKGKSFEGRPSFSPSILCKLYLYGYLNGVRSSRKLDKACKLNIELWWLLDNQKPGYKTIANFRKDNAKGFGNLFSSFRNFCINIDLYGRKVIAIDGSKFRGQNSMKNNYNQRKIDKNYEYLTQQYNDYVKELDRNDEYDKDNKILNNLNKRLAKYDKLQDQLNATQETQISTTDPDARALPLHMRIVQVGYNLQSAVDAKHKLIAEFDITNKNDNRALAPMAIKTKQALGLKTEDRLTALADKGYHTGDQLQKCHDNNIDTLVAAPRKNTSKDGSKPEHLTKDNFKFNKKSNTYTCPEGQTLEHQNTYHRKKKGLPIGAPFDRYKMDWNVCKVCPQYEDCVSQANKNKKTGRYIDRVQTDGAVVKNKKMVKSGKELYRKRQALVEHPFGTIKRQWGYNHTLMKTIPKVKTEFSIITLVYNIRRVMSILDVNGLVLALKEAKNSFLRLRDTIKYHSAVIVASFCIAPLCLTYLKAK